MTRMSKRTCPVTLQAQHRRNLEETIRGQLSQVIMAANNKVLASGKGRWGGEIDSVYCGPDMWSVVGDEVAAALAGKLLRQGGLRNVEVYRNDLGRWVASGLVH